MPLASGDAPIIENINNSVGRYCLIP